MKKNIFKWCVFLIILSFALFAVSCGDQNEDKNIGQTGDAESAEPIDSIEPAQSDEGDIIDMNIDLTPYLPEKDFDGYTFKVLNIDPSMYWCLSNIVVEEESGDMVNDAIYRRNLTIMEKYNIEIKHYPGVGFGGIGGLIKKSNNAGDNIYDIAFPYIQEAANLAVDGQLHNLIDVPYIDNTKPWWLKKADDAVELGGKRFFGTNDIDIANVESTWSMEFNKLIIQKYGLDSPYDLVLSGKWTLDKFLEMCKAAAQDLDASGKIDSAEDQAGYVALLSPGNGGCLALLQSGGEYMVRKNAEGYPEINITNERFINVYTKVIDVLFNHNVGINGNTIWDGVSPVQLMFESDKTLFIWDILGYGRILREMKSDFGILPLPKYDENQESYCTPVTNGAPVICIPIINEDLERTGIIIEALAAESSRTLIPAYINVALGVKYARDEESLPMVNLILDTRIYDMANVYQWGNIMNAIGGAMEKNSTDIVSVAEKNMDKLQAAIDKSIEKITN